MIYRFGEFELDEARFELRRAGVQIPLERRVFDLLALLVRNSGRVVTKTEIFEAVWSGRIVSDGSLTVAISAARKALGDNATRQESIRTSPGRGYELTRPAFALPDTASAIRLADVSQHFVGRTEEILLFDSLIELAPSTVADVVVISGEPGLGKSRLLSEFARRAALRSCPMHIVQCPESERTPFLWPCVQLIRRLAQDTDAHWKRSLHATHAAFLSRLLPELISGEPGKLASDPAAASFQLFESIAALLSHLCRDHRPVLAIDDFHRCDEATARFIQFAVQEFPTLPFLLVVTHRPAEAAQSAVHSLAISTLTRRPAAITQALKGLSADETAELAAVLSSDAADHLSAQDLRDHTGGNPFFIRQLVPLLPVHSNTSLWTTLPPSVSHLIAERVPHLQRLHRMSLARLRWSVVSLTCRCFASYLRQLMSARRSARP
jgi:DNA-binding winged helix-turn-helix (wHTH) protein